MPRRIPRSEAQSDMVVAPGVDGTSARQPDFQTVETYSQEEYIQLPITPTVNGASFQETSREILFDLEPNDCGEIKDIELRFSVSSAAGITLVPSAYLIKRVIVECNKSMGDEIARVYPINIQLYQFMNQSQAQIKQNSQAHCYQLYDYSNGVKQRYGHGEKTTLDAGEQRDIYLPIPVNVFQAGVIDMRHIRQALRFRIQLNGEIDALNGGSGDLVLEDLHFVIRSVKCDEQDKLHASRLKQKENCKYTYLDSDRLVVNDKNIQAGVVNRYALDSFTGESPFLVVVFKESTSPSGAQEYDFYELGYGDATIDLTNSSGSSMFGNGTAVPVEQVYKHWVDELGQPPLAGVYVLPFCENLGETYMGKRSGYHRFEGQKDFLEIKPSTRQQLEQHRLQCVDADGLGVTGSDTYARYAVSASKGGSSSTTVSLDALAADLKVHIELIPEFIEKGYSVTVTNTHDTSGQVDIKFDTYRNENVVDDIGLMVQSRLLPTSLSLISHMHSSLITRGRIGWETSSNRTCEIYMYKYKQLTVTKDGRLEVHDY